MKLFGFNKKSKEENFTITDPDKEWVEDNFKWLVIVFGYPSPNDEQYLITEKYFPITFSTDKIIIENVIKDLCSLLNIKDSKIAVKLSHDIRDTYGVPYEIHGGKFETEFEKQEDKYVIHIANNLLNYPNRLIYNLVYEFIGIKLTDHELEYDTGDDTDLFTYIAGIFFGFGVILSQNLNEKGRVDDGFWETKWNYISEMPNEVMAYSLALYSKIIKQESPIWRDSLPSQMKNYFGQAIITLNRESSEFLKELQAYELFQIAFEQYQNNNFEEAISNLQKILFLPTDDQLKADVYNNLGYYLLRLGEYEKCISYFKKTLQIEPNHGFAKDNIGYAFINLGELELGKKWLEKASKTGNNDLAYHFRNHALYYQSKGDMNLAEEYFSKAFEQSDSVDLLEYHYANFLFQKGNNKLGLDYLNLAKGKGEPEAIKKANELTKN